MPRTHSLSFAPLAPDRWDDFARLFGKNGACSGCWCTWFRATRKEYQVRSNAGNRAVMKKTVDSGSEPGIIAYRDGDPVGWVSLAPREEFPRLDRSIVAKAVDERRVWSIVCFFIPRAQRGTGLAEALLKESIRYARARGARLLEAYPVDPSHGPVSDDHAFHGLLPWFERVGFREVARQRPARPLVRKHIRAAR